MKITIVVAEPNKPARVQVVENTLLSLQDLVGGYIEQLPAGMFRTLDGLGVHAWVNEDGKRMELPTNVIVNGWHGDAVDRVVGPIVVSRADDNGTEIGLGEESGIVRQFLDDMRDIK